MTTGHSLTKLSTTFLSLVACFGLATLAGCGTQGQSGTDSGAIVAGRAAGQGVENSGIYPNLNIKPEIAADQMSADQKAKLVENLERSKSRAVHSASPTGLTDQATMRKIGQTHGEDALKVIEAESKE